MRKISIVIPAYNASSTIKRCINSVLSQSYQDFELIIVNDGSTDNTYDICQEYAARDSRIILINKENGGVVSSRQCGLEKITGEYSIQIDSDDYIDSGMLETMIEVAINDDADIVYTDYYYQINGKESAVSQDFGTLDPTTLIKQNIEGKFFGALWNKLIRHTLFIENNISFEKNVLFSEDSLVLIKLLQASKKISYIPKPFYHYINYPDSISQRNTVKEIEQKITYINALEKALIKKKLYDKSILKNKFQIIRRALYCPSYPLDNIRNIFPEIFTPLNIIHSKLKLSTKFLLIMLYLKMNFIPIAIMKSIKK